MLASLTPGRLLAQEDVLDDPLPHEVVHVQEDADDHARDQDDRGALDDLVLPGPVDLLELGPRLADEPAAAPRVPLDLARDTRLARGGRACVRFARHG